MTLANWNAVAVALLGLAAWPVCSPGETASFDFAEGRIACRIVTERESIPALVLAVLPMAVNAAVEHIGPPAEPATVTLRLLAPPSYYKRIKALFRAEAFAIQQGDEIAVHAGNDPLKLAFRLGHEISHWLVHKKHAARPPLWLDEGLAQLVGATAADHAARVHKQTLDRPLPAKLERNLFPLEELTALADYPRSTGRSAAFYWQAETLVRALRHKLGPTDFAIYLALLSARDAPGWSEPLRVRWYFSDWDMAWLARQIQPEKQEPP